MGRGSFIRDPVGVGATADFLQVGGEAPPLPTTPRPEEEVKALLREVLAEVRALRDGERRSAAGVEVLVTLAVMRR